MTPNWTTHVRADRMRRTRHPKFTVERGTKLVRIGYKTHRLTILSSFLCLSTGCGFDPASAEYDERRYTELQKANCHEVATAGASKLMDKSPEKTEVILERCQSLQQLTLEQYRLAAEYARQHEGKWDITAALGAASSAPETTTSTAP